MTYINNLYKENYSPPHFCFRLCTSDCTSVHSEKCIIEFSDDIAILSLLHGRSKPQTYHAKLEQSLYSGLNKTSSSQMWRRLCWCLTQKLFVTTVLWLSITHPCLCLFLQIPRTTLIRITAWMSLSTICVLGLANVFPLQNEGIWSGSETHVTFSTELLESIIRYGITALYDNLTITGSLHIGVSPASSWVSFCFPIHVCLGFLCCFLIMLLSISFGGWELW